MKNIKTLGQAIAFLEELHGAEGEYRNLNREDIIDMREDIHRARAALSEDEYSDEEHQLALHANDILLKATFDSRENLLNEILAEQAKCEEHLRELNWAHCEATTDEEFARIWNEIEDVQDHLRVLNIRRCRAGLANTPHG